MTTLVLGAHGPLGLACVRAVLAGGDTVIAGVQSPHRVPPALADLRGDHAGQLQVVSWQPGDWSLAPTVSRAIIAELPVPPVQLDEPDDPTSALRDLSADALQRDIARLLPPTVASLQVAARLRPARVLLQASWLGSVSNKIRGGGYAVAAAYAAHLMLVRTAALDLQRDGIAVVVGNAGRYRLDLAGPEFHADIDDVARGLLALLDAADAADEPRFADWRGTPQAW